MNNNIRAAGIMIMAMALISLNDAIVKLLSESYGVGQILFLRGLVTCVLFFLLVLHKNELMAIVSLQNRFVISRGVFELLATLAFITGLSLLPLATAATLVFTSPIFLTITATLILHERVGGSRWGAVLTGFCGVLLITRPGDENWSWAILLPLLAACLVVGRDLCTRQVPASIPSELVAFATAVLVTLSGLILSSLSWSPIQFKHLLLFILSGLCVGGAYFFYIVAIRTGELSFVSPFTYTSIAMAIVLGMLIWHDIPTWTMLAGAGLIIVSGIVIIQRERRQLRQSG